MVSWEADACSSDSIGRVMAEFRDEMQHYSLIGTRIAASTRLIIRTVLSRLLLSSIYTVFLICKMSVNMSVMTTRLASMYGSSGTMADDRHGISRMVNSMGKSLGGFKPARSETPQPNSGREHDPVSFN
jgi:hypothetical protein